jgi:hypothetical protein
VPVKGGDDGVKNTDAGLVSWQRGEDDGGSGIPSRGGGEDGEAPTSSSSAMRSMRGDSAGAMVLG